MKWEDLPIQEQIRYEELVSKFYPNLNQEELEKKAKKYYESSTTKYK